MYFEEHFEYVQHVIINVPWIKRYGWISFLFEIYMDIMDVYGYYEYNLNIKFQKCLFMKNQRIIQLQNNLRDLVVKFWDL